MNEEEERQYKLKQFDELLADAELLVDHNITLESERNEAQAILVNLCFRRPDIVPLVESIRAEYHQAIKGNNQEVGDELV